MTGRRGFNAVTDNVARCEELQRRFPHIAITHTDDPWLWTAQWKDDSGEHALIRPELGQLLDALDVALG